MPCNSDYMEANDQEIEASKVLALLEELETGKLPKYYGDGYYSKVYNRGSDQLKKHTPILCSKLKSVKDVSKYSLEMQIWWRDHQKADKIRESKNK